MIITERQKRILQGLVENGDGISLAELEKRLDASRRTLYRELGLLRPELSKLDLTISNKKGRLSLVGSPEGLAGLKEKLAGSQGQEEMKAEDRANALAVLLLLEDEPVKILSLAGRLGVSEATAQADLDSVAASLATYGIKLLRTKGLGVSVETCEDQRRKVLSSILLSEINDYLFFDYLTDPSKEKSGNFFIDLLPKKLLLTCWEALKKEKLSEFSLETDYQEIELILLFTLSIIRLRAGKHVSKKQDSPQLKYQSYVFNVFSRLSREIEITPPLEEARFLALQVEKCDYQRQDFAGGDEEVVITLRVSQFIQDVSDQVHFDFGKSPLFIRRLQNHIRGLVEHSSERLPNAKIETLDNLTATFPNLYQAIQKAWTEDFQDEINRAELQLILLYFANEYGNYTPQDNLSVLVICDNGLGTSAILASRLKKEVSEIRSVKTARASEISQLNLSDYDIIFSTLNLPGFPRDYHLVSPLLLGSELAQVKKDVASYLAKYKKQTPNKAFKQKISKPQSKLAALAKSATFCQKLLDDLTIKEVDYPVTSTEDMLTAVISLVPEDYLKDRREVIAKLQARIKLAPLGLPGSQLALLHTKTSAVNKTFFAFYDLKKPLKMKAMDQTEIAVKRQMLFLAPENLTAAEGDVLGMISSMLVVSDDLLKLFSTGDKEEIANAIARQYLGQLDQLVD
ncbi:BglG family transcription antiterminator [Lactobacillus sp.]|uniref:BglG family transcription antiterminator n=1 Tax=Lactobacillus sp. TaxID=1591 RepID=UPI003EF8AD5A